MVFTQPDKPTGRGRKTVAPPVKSFALDKNLTVYQPEDLVSEKWKKLLEGAKADVAVVAAYGRILPEALLKTTTAGFINVHASILPNYRGAAPIQWAIRNRDTQTGITLMQMDAHMDTGDILSQETLDIAQDDTTGQLFERLAILGAKMLIRDLPGIVNGTITPTKQDHNLATYSPAFPAEDERVCWEQSAEDLHALIRAYLPETGCYTFLDGKRFKLFTTAYSTDNTEQPPGTIVAVYKDRFSVQTGDGLLEVFEVQAPGKKRMQTRDYLNGYPLKPGTLFDS